MALEIQIQDPAGGNRKLRFAQSPVRLGRSPANELPLDDGFVSEWHGVIRFEGRSVTYTDLGSRNGSFVDGQKLSKDAPVPLAPASRLTLGRIELRLALTEESDAIDISVEEPNAVTGGKTLGWGIGRRLSPTPAAGLAGLVAPPLAPTPPSVPMGSVDIPLNTPPPYSSAAQPPVPAPPPLGARLPHPSPPMAGFPPLEAVSAPTPAAVPAAVMSASAEVIARQAKLLDAFCEAFVSLRKGYEQFGSEVGVRVVSGATPIHRARSGRELLEHLMEPASNPESRARDLAAVFADLGIHNIALMDAITEGVRSVVQSLDPRTNSIDSGGRLFKGGKGNKDWQHYVERFEQLVTDDNDLHAAIFGDEFARAYAAVTRRDNSGDRSGKRRK